MTGMHAAQDLPPEQAESLLRLFTSDVVASIKARKLEQAQVVPAEFDIRELCTVPQPDSSCCSASLG